MSTLVELRKSFVDGEWKAITRVPRRELSDAVRGKRFGQKHLSEINRAKNSALHQSAGISRARRSVSTPTGRLIHNPFTGRKMEEISSGPLAGPHVNWAHTPGQRTQIRINNESHQEVRDNLGRIRGSGTKMTTNRGLINLHEMAHGMVRRPFPTRQASVMNRAWSQDPKDTSRVVTLLNHGGSLTGEQKAAALASVTRVNGQVHAVDARQTIGEEARADVMASRKAKRLMVSGHVTDSGDPSDYLRRRNEIESRMGVPRTRMDQVFGLPVAPPKPTKRRSQTRQEIRERFRQMLGK